MSEPEDNSDHQPSQADVAYDLERALTSVVYLQTRIPDDALTAQILGTERAGHGVMIRDNGLIVTIGYLIAEADTVWVFDNRGRAVPGHVVGYDQETGFGLVQTLQALNLPTLALGSSAALAIGEPVVVGGHGGRSHAVKARVIAKQEFAGYWEYLLDQAIFTAPAHNNWGGTALIGADGTLRGIGSLMVQQSSGGETADANMIVPIDLLKPILDDLTLYGRANRPPRPWLGMMTTEIKGHLVVVGLVDEGPASQADVRVGDLVLEVAGQPVDELATLFRRVWGLGKAGVEVPFKLYRNGESFEVKVQSVSRYDKLKSPHLH